MSTAEQLDQEIIDLEISTRSDRVFEKVYTSDSPEVIQWTTYFYKKAVIPDIFKDIWNQMSTKRKLNAEVIGSFWHKFSALAPKVMCNGAAKVSNNLMRHFIVQIIYEELGKRDHRCIHPDFFLDCVDKAGIVEARRLYLLQKYKDYVPFKYLEKIMSDAKNDSMVLGILLGLEINAEENIHTIFEALSFDETQRVLMTRTPFFAIHRAAEKEHIRLDVANFLRFCPDHENKDDFIQGFHQAVYFWMMFWKGMARIIEEENLA